MKIVIDAAGAQMGGAARYLGELRRYLLRTGREDVRVIGSGRRLGSAWLVSRELTGQARGSRVRRVALNNVGFLAPGSQRWTLLRNALHFLTEDEESQLDPSLRASIRRDAPVVRLAAHRSHVLVAPSTAMAERVRRAVPGLRGRLVVRAHPVSADSIPRLPREPAILCPVLFAPYKQMDERLAELLAALDSDSEPGIRLWVTATQAEIAPALARHPRVQLVGHLDHRDLRQLQARSRALYFPSGLESFGYPSPAARVSGQPVIARDTAQNAEIAGPALCGFTPGEAGSLRRAVGRAQTLEVAPDPAPFDPDAYFGWLLGADR